MARPKTIHIDESKIQQLVRLGYGARRVARELRISVSTARRAIRAQGSEPGPPVLGRTSVQPRTGSVPVVPDPRSTTGFRTVRRTDTNSAIGRFNAPSSPLADKCMMKAREELLLYRGTLTDHEFHSAAGRLADALRSNPAGSHYALFEDHIRDLETENCRRDYWLAEAAADLRRRWTTEADAIAGLVGCSFGIPTLRAETDAAMHLSRLKERLPRHLVDVTTGDSYVSAVEVVLAPSIAEHRAFVEELMRSAPAP